MPTLLKQFARKRRKEETTVITARLPNSRYEQFKSYCEELGLSINEAVNLLIDRELAELEKELKNNTQLVSDDESKGNTKEIQPKINSAKSNTAEMNTAKINSAKTDDSKRFTLKSFKVGKELPCPICMDWRDSSNFARHASKQHNTTTEELYTKYGDKVQTMIQAKLESERQGDSAE